MSQTVATMIAASRAADSYRQSLHDDCADHRDNVRAAKVRAIQSGSTVSGERYALATAAGRSEALVTSHVLLRGTEDIVGFSNNIRRDFSLPKRALSMASSKGRCTPDMLASLMSFFSNPGDMAHTLLASFLPTKVSTDSAKTLLSDPFVVDVIEGLGFTIPTPAEAVKACKNPSTGRSGGAPSRLIVADGVTPATVPSGKRGRPSGPKYVAWLRPTADVVTAAALLLTGPRPMVGCTDLTGIPGGNDVAQGTGHDAGKGWPKAWAERKTLSPAQIQRRDAALDAYHAEAQRMAAAALAEQ